MDTSAGQLFKKIVKSIEPEDGDIITINQSGSKYILIFESISPSTNFINYHALLHSGIVAGGIITTMLV